MFFQQSGLCWCFPGFSGRFSGVCENPEEQEQEDSMMFDGARYYSSSLSWPIRLHLLHFTCHVQQAPFQLQNASPDGTVSSRVRPVRSDCPMWNDSGVRVPPGHRVTRTRRLERHKGHRRRDEWSQDATISSSWPYY